jgi:hypothetical protein
MKKKKLVELHGSGMEWAPFYEWDYASTIAEITEAIWFNDDANFFLPVQDRAYSDTAVRWEKSPKRKRVKHA